MTDDIPTTHQPAHIGADLAELLFVVLPFAAFITCVLVFLVVLYYLDAWAWVLLGYGALAGAWWFMDKVTRR